MINEFGFWQDEGYQSDIDYENEVWPDDDYEDYQFGDYHDDHDDQDDDYDGDPTDLMLEYELLRIPPEIRTALEARLRVQPNFVVAWLQAICASFPERKLIDVVREGDLRLFPPCLCRKDAEEFMPGYLVLIDNDIVSIRDDWPRKENKSREASRLVELEAFRACRFQQGFASEGMLCDQPPIPLRVLDFLETQDLVNLSLVCKSAHQAAHVLFRREEAVAASSYPAQFAAIDRQADLLRDIRLASLMHGTPETIPAGSVGDRFIRASPAEPASLRSVTWLFHGGGHGLYDILDPALYGNPGKFSARRWRALDDMCVLEGPHLQAVQAELVHLQTEYLGDLQQAYEDDVEMVRKLLLVVNDALALGESILLRAYHIDRP